MLSIIIPTRNEESVIEATLTHLKRGLVRTPYEIIVSDGNSTDRTVEIAKAHADHVIEETEPSKRTIGRGRNVGAAKASGEYFVFIDADIFIPDPDNFFEKALSLFKGNPTLVGMTVKLRVHPENETLADRLFIGGMNAVFILANNVFKTGGASGEFHMIRADAFRKTGGYREDLAVSEDNDLFFRLAKIGRTRIERSLTVYHTGRRGHAVGWPRLLWQWTINSIWLFCFDRSFHREWEPIR